MQIHQILCVHLHLPKIRHWPRFQTVWSYQPGEDSLRDDTEAFGMRLAKAGVCVTMQRITEAMHGFTTNRTPGWERALDRQYKFFQEHLR